MPVHAPVARVYGPPDTVGDCTIVQNTRAGQVQMFTYVVDDLLQLQPNDDLYRAFMFNGFSEFGDLVALSSEDIDNLSYPDPDPEGVLPIPVV